MLSCPAIQRLERHGAVMVRGEWRHMITSALKDAKQHNVTAVTRTETWKDALAGLGGENSVKGGSVGAFATENFVQAASMVVGFLASPWIESAIPVAPTIRELKSADYVALLDTLCSIISILDSNNVNFSVLLTESYGNLLGAASDFFLALQAQLTTVKIGCDGTEVSVAAVISTLKRLMFVSAQKFRGVYAMYPAPKLLFTDTAAISAKKSLHDQKFRGSLSVKLALVANTVTKAANVSTGDAALADCLARAVAPGISNRATRLVVYFRGDEYKLTQAGVKTASEYSLHTYATNAPLGTVCRYNNEASVEVARAWLASLPFLLKAFLADGMWTQMAKEQRRMKLQKEIQKRKEERRGKTTTAKKSSLTSKDLGEGGKDGKRDTEGLSDAGSHLTHTSNASTLLSALNRRQTTGDDEELISLLDTVDADTRSMISNMSHQSASSYLSFLSVIDAAQVEREQHQLHESADGNTNLSLIFLEQIVLAVHQFIESLPLEFLQSSGLANAAWTQLSKLFLVLQQSIKTVASDAAPVSDFVADFSAAVIDLKRTPMFHFSHDMRFNGGLAYQSLGVLFAKVMSPLLEDADTQAIVEPVVAATTVTSWAKFRSAAQEHALTTCLGVYETVAPQVINMNLKRIISVAAASIHQVLKQSKKASTEPRDAQERCALLEHFIVRIIERLGKSNSALLFMETIVNSYEAAVEANEAATRRNLYSLISREAIRAAMVAAIEESMDTESLLMFIGRLAETAASTDIQSALALEKAVVMLDTLSICAQGISVNSLTASMIAEKVAEVDLLVVSGLSDIKAALDSSDEESKGLEVPHRVVVRSVCQAALQLRKLMDRCFVDLGVENIEKFLDVFEESLWQFSAKIEEVAGCLGAQELQAMLPCAEDRELVSDLVLQRLALSHSVLTILDRHISSKSEAKGMASFVLDTFAAREARKKESRSDDWLMTISRQEWSALARFGQKKMISTLTPILKQRCAAVNPVAFASSWISTAGALLDALAVVLIESQLDSDELPAVAAVLHNLVVSKATLPRMPHVVNCLGGLLLAGCEEVQSTTVEAGRESIVRARITIVCDLLIAIIQSNESVGLIFCRGGSALHYRLRPTFVEYVEGTNELVAEESQAADSIPTTFFTKKAAQLITSVSGFLPSCARLLALLASIASSHRSDKKSVEAAAHGPSIFHDAVVKQLLKQVRQDMVAPLKAILVATEGTKWRKEKSKKRSRDDEATTPTAENVEVSMWDNWRALLSCLLEQFIANPKAVDAKGTSDLAYCLRSLQERLGEYSYPDTAKVLAISKQIDLYDCADTTMIVFNLLKGVADADGSTLHMIEEHVKAMDAGLRINWLRQQLRIVPEALHCHGDSHAMLVNFVHMILRHAIPAANNRSECTAVTEPSAFSDALVALVRISRSSNVFRFSALKHHVKHSIAFLSRSLVAYDPQQGDELKHLENVIQMFNLIRLPLPQYHGDEAFVDMELEYIVMLPSVLARILASNKQPDKAALNEKLRTIVMRVFQTLSSTFIELRCFRHRSHLMAPLLSSWFAMILQGLQLQIFDGTVTNMYVAFLFRLTQSLHRAVDLSNVTSTSQQGSVELDIDSVMLQQASVIASMFTISSHYVSVFTRFASELDFVAFDVIKLIQKEKLPSLYSHVVKRKEDSYKNLSANSYADLAYVAVKLDEGKNLLKQAVLSVADDEEDNSKLFSAKDRFGGK